MATALHKEKIIPEVVDDFTPTIELHVTYPKGEVKMGNEFRPSDVASEPKVQWDVDSSSFYTLANVDPDAPSRANPKFREWRHWLVANISGSDVKTGDIISSYVGAGPPKDTGLHRYAFLLYKQPGRISAEKLNDEGMSRANFSIRNWAKAHSLGTPIAANFYQAKH